MARIKAMLRRPRAMADHAVASRPSGTLGDLVVDTEARRVWRAGDELTLTRTEFDLLEALTDSPRRAFSRRQLIDRIWGPDWFGDEHVVDVHRPSAPQTGR